MILVHISEGKVRGNVSDGEADITEGKGRRKDKEDAKGKKARGSIRKEMMGTFNCG